MKNNRFFTMIIETITEGSDVGYAITLPNLHNSVVLGENYQELAKGIRMTFEDEKIPFTPGLLKGLKRQIDLVEKSRIVANNLL
jgi:hypothetical protein